MDKPNDPQASVPIEDTNEITPPPHKPMLVHIVIGFMLLLVGFGGGYYLGQLSSSAKAIAPSQQITPSLIPTVVSQKKPTEKVIENLDIKIFQDQVNHFTFQYPSKFVAQELIQRGHLLNNKILISSSNTSYKDCRGGCAVNEIEETVTLSNNLQATKIKGFVGGVGGNIPQSFIQYEIVNPMPNPTNRYVSITLWELPQNIPYQEMIKDYPNDRIHQPISLDDEKEFDQILSTFEFVK